jgi:hypothetical protein
MDMSGPVFRIAISVVTGLAVASCTEPSTRGNDVDFPFPDSITRSWGMPPVAVDAGAILFASDTVAIGKVLGPSLFEGNETKTVTAELLVTDSLNQLRSSTAIPLADCPFVLTVSRVGKSSPIWSSERASMGQCPPLVNGAIATSASWPVTSILGDSLPIGDYEASFDLHTASGRVLHSRPTRVYLYTEAITISTDYHDLQWSASTTTNVDEREFVTRVVVHNPTDRYIELRTGSPGCSVIIQLFRKPSVMPQPSWSSDFGQNSCDAVLVLSRVHPGDSSVFISRRAMEDVTDYHMPAGRYLVSARMPDLGLSGPAGWVDILPPTGLRSSGVFDSLTAAATTRVIPGNGDDTLRTLVLVTNRTDHRIVTTVPSKCPVGISAFRDADMRDEVRLESPTFIPGPPCYSNSYAFALDPGQSWVFGRDTPMSLLRAKGGAGHYWFTATLLTRKLVYLTAGDADVR